VQSVHGCASGAPKRAAWAVRVWDLSYLAVGISCSLCDTANAPQATEAPTRCTQSFAQQIGLPLQGRSRLVNRLLLVFITHLGPNNQDVAECSATCAETPAPKYDIPSAGAYKELLLLCEAMGLYLAPGLTNTNVDAGTFAAPTKDIILSAPLRTIQPFAAAFIA
jgi:hypothetical protein